MTKEELRERFDEAVSNVSEGYPYKVVGRPETYSDYNQGWSDASDIVSQKLWDFFWAEIEKRDKEIAEAYDDGYEAGYRLSLERIKELEAKLNQKQDE